MSEITPSPPSPDAPPEGGALRDKFDAMLLDTSDLVNYALLLPLRASWLQESVTNTGITLAVVVAIAIAGSGIGNGSCGGSAMGMGGGGGKGLGGGECNAGYSTVPPG